MRRLYAVGVAAALCLAVSGTLATALPAQAAAPRSPGNCTATACHFDVPPGTYDVKVLLGGEGAARTAIVGESRRALLPETATAAGERVARSFTVNVRTPEGEPTGPDGTPGLDLTIGGPAPALAGIEVTPARHARQIFLVGDSTVCDQPGSPTPAGGSSCRSTSARDCPSPTTPTPARARSVTLPTRGCGEPSGR